MDGITMIVLVRQKRREIQFISFLLCMGDIAKYPLGGIG